MSMFGDFAKHALLEMPICGIVDLVTGTVDDDYYD